MGWPRGVVSCGDYGNGRWAVGVSMGRMRMGVALADQGARLSPRGYLLLVGGSMRRNGGCCWNDGDAGRMDVMLGPVGILFTPPHSDCRFRRERWAFLVDVAMTRKGHSG